MPDIGHERRSLLINYLAVDGVLSKDRVNCCRANQDKFWVEDPDGVEWELYVLNHDIADDTAGCATTQPMKSSLGVIKAAASSCCSPTR